MAKTHAKSGNKKRIRKNDISHTSMSTKLKKASNADGRSENLHAARKEKKILETPHQDKSSLSCLYTQTHDIA